MELKERRDRRDKLIDVSINEEVKIIGDQDDFRITYVEYSEKMKKKIWKKSNYLNNFDRMINFIIDHKLQTSHDFVKIVDAYETVKTMCLRTPIFNKKNFIEKYGDIRETITVNDYFDIQCVKYTWKLIRKKDHRVIESFFTRFDLLMKYMSDQYLREVIRGNVSTDDYITQMRESETFLGGIIDGKGYIR